MPTTKSPRRLQSVGAIKDLIGLGGVGILFAAAGFGFAASQETHDPFCASCHSQPETSYVERSTAPQPVDLASYHAGQHTRCIDCHSGPGVPGRMRAELLGARNAAAWFSGLAAQPAPLTSPIQDGNCLKCHRDVTFTGYLPKQPVSFLQEGARGEGGEEAGPNHWHEQLIRWQAVTPDAGRCTSCHPGHSTVGSADSGFEDPGTTQNVCEACHQDIGEG